RPVCRYVRLPVAGKSDYPLAVADHDGQWWAVPPRCSVDSAVRDAVPVGGGESTRIREGCAGSRHSLCRHHGERQPDRQKTTESKLSSELISGKAQGGL